jgi:transcription elongation factor GreA
MVEARIKELEDKLSRANVIDLSKVDSDQVRFGARVTISDEETGEEKTYQIVGDIEADLNTGKISLSSPIAKALLGKRLDDIVSVRVPAGLRECVITQVNYK